VTLTDKLRRHARPPTGQGIPCPRVELHHEGLDRPGPDGYLTWHEWAERMSKTYRQRRCPGCGLFRVWEAKGS
jgi:hypothetical protein